MLINCKADYRSNELKCKNVALMELKTWGKKVKRKRMNTFEASSNYEETTSLQSMKDYH